MPIPGPVCSFRINDAIAEATAAGNHTAPNKNPVKHHYSAPRKPNPRIMQSINEELGTKINFSKLADFEGGQILSGYIPGHTLGSKGTTVEGNSGVTIATGYDIGQRTEARMTTDFGFSDRLVEKYGKFCGLTKYLAIRALERSGGLEIEQYEADETDFKVQRFHLIAAMDTWDEDPEPTMEFRKLSMAQQTVILSRTYHQGIEMPYSAIAEGFYTAAQNGDWVKAERELRSYNVGGQDWYRIRVCAEADYLAEERRRQKDVEDWLAKTTIP